MSKMVRFSSLHGIFKYYELFAPSHNPEVFTNSVGPNRSHTIIKSRGKSPVLWSGLSWVDPPHRVNPNAPYPLDRIVPEKLPLNLAHQLL